MSIISRLDLNLTVRLVGASVKGIEMAQKAIFFCLMLLSCKAAYACTCIRPEHRDEFRQSDAVLVAKVIEVKEDPSYSPAKLGISPTIQKMVDSTKRYIVKLRVDKNFKGVATKEILLYAFTSDGGCSGITFTQGEKYLIYADREDGVLSYGSICSRTAKLDRTSDEYLELRRSFRKWST